MAQAKADQIGGLELHPCSETRNPTCGNYQAFDNEIGSCYATYPGYHGVLGGEFRFGPMGGCLKDETKESGTWRSNPNSGSSCVLDWVGDRTRTSEVGVQGPCLALRELTRKHHLYLIPKSF